MQLTQKLKLKTRTEKFRKHQILYQTTCMSEINLVR